MSLGNLIGTGFSGYAIINNIPVPLASSTAPESENILKSEGAYNYDPALAVGPLPAKSRRSLKISIPTILCIRTLPLIKALTYGWRSTFLMDTVPEVPFVYVGGNNEGYIGTGYVDSLDITCASGSNVTITVNLTAWVWRDVFGTGAIPKLGGVIAPLDNAYKPISFWQTAPICSFIGANSIPLSWSLRLNNNWNYQTFLGGYQTPPNPALITAGDLDVAFGISWLANINDRPIDNGSVQIKLGVPVLDTILLNRVVRDPERQFEGVGQGNDTIKWAGSYYAQGIIPISR